MGTEVVGARVAGAEVVGASVEVAGMMWQRHRAALRNKSNKLFSTCSVGTLGVRRACKLPSMRSDRLGAPANIRPGSIRPPPSGHSSKSVIHPGKL